MVILNLTKCSIKAHTVSVTTVASQATVHLLRYLTRFYSLVTITCRFTTMVLEHQCDVSRHRTRRIGCCDSSSDCHVGCNTSTDHTIVRVQCQSIRKRRVSRETAHFTRHSRTQRYHLIHKVRVSNLVVQIRRRKKRTMVILNLTKCSIKAHTVSVTTVARQTIALTLLLSVVVRLPCGVHAVQRRLQDRDIHVLVPVALEPAHHKAAQRRVHVVQAQLAALAVHRNPAGGGQGVIVPREHGPHAHVLRAARRLEARRLVRADHRVVLQRVRERLRLPAVVARGEGGISQTNVPAPAHRHAHRRGVPRQLDAPAERAHARHGGGLRARARVGTQRRSALRLRAGHDRHLHLRRQQRRGISHQAEVVHHGLAAHGELQVEDDGPQRAHVVLPLGGEVAVEESGEGVVGGEGGGVGLERRGGQHAGREVEGHAAEERRGDAHDDGVLALTEEGGGQCRC